MKYKEKTLKIIIYLGIIFTYLILDVGLRYLVCNRIGFVSVKSYSPLAFSLSYIILIIELMNIFTKRAKQIYVITSLIANIYFFAQIIHFKILDNFFSIISFSSMGEASNYLKYVLKSTSDEIIIVILLSILSMITVLNMMKKVKPFNYNKKNNYYFINYYNNAKG